jgi:acetyl esterase/lipase
MQPPILDVAYGTGPHQTLDIYLPRTKPYDTVIMFWHGGTWRRGDKKNYGFIGRTLAGMGYTVVLPNYRLYPAVKFPAFIEDAATATQWVDRKHHPRRIILMGHSAGAHIAAVLALDDRYFKALPTPHPVIAGFIGLAGAYNPRRWGGNVALGSGDSVRWNPLDLVTSAAPPMLLVHGRLDTTVAPSQTAQLAHAVNVAGGRAEVHFYPIMEHFSVVLPFVPGFGYYTSLRRDIRRFITSLESA